MTPAPASSNLTTRVVRTSVPTGRLLPPGRRIYAIGDIHGQADLLATLMEGIDQLEATLPPAFVQEVYLGDYVDRGPASAAIIERLAAAAPPPRRRVCLCGNHEWLMRSFLRDPRTFESWRSVGGFDTLTSYGVARRLIPDDKSLHELWREFNSALPPDHRQFLHHLWPFFRIGDYFFVHAGLRPRVPLEQQTERDMMWIRSEFLAASEEIGITVVHGHTPAANVEITPHRIGVDTGAYATRTLSCVMLQHGTATVLQAAPDDRPDRLRWSPPL
jgi:serine/threonine protein phosphatase 1